MTSPEESVQDDLDSPWKEALERYFPEFLGLLFPVVEREVDWSRGFSFLDKEMLQVVRDSNHGRRYADKLAKIYTHDGTETWLLIHVEVQGRVDQDFDQRMFVYNYRIFDRYRVEVLSLAVITGGSDAKIGEYRRERAGCRLLFQFPSCSLQEWAGRWSELEASNNLFAVVVMAHIKANESRDGDHRLYWKMQLIRMLYQRQYSRADILELFRVIDWVLTLPVSAQERFIAELKAFEEEMKMPYVTSVERYGREQGLKEGISQGISQGIGQGEKLGEVKLLLRQLELKYGPRAAADWRKRVEEADSQSLLTWSEKILTANTIDEVFH
ncbi:hypothetical protein [Desulfurivibrio dismutans]|uniref:hypothetical protein n=1 Tax=Desulfurivibrio dismutans TaxID=1398908 RepID=UPI0023DC52DC|nr:hypothetical protein [Desulfurivibrio alkaliphilus]MDF1615804.1 hypothetical protein [Desulfurivibrio alkaliphilus]